MVQKRNTRQKEEIANALDKMEAFFTAEDLHRCCKKHEIGIATIYRYLKDELASGMLYSYTCNRRRVYSKKDTSHCHFICEKTGKITHFNIDSLDFLKDRIPGSIKSFQIEVRGECGGKCGSWK